MTPGGRRRNSSAVASLLAVLLSLGAAATAVRPAPQAARAAANNGTCLSRLEPFGYKCEEHTVRKRQNNDVRHTAIVVQFFIFLPED